VCADDCTSLVDLAGESPILLALTTKERTQTQMAQVTLTEAVRKRIKDVLTYAARHRLQEGQDTAALEHYRVAVSPQVRVHYVEHQTTPDRIMAHLSIHANPSFQLDDQIIEQLAKEFGLGPRNEWQQVLMNLPPLPSAHIFRTRPIGTAA
jgi:hypothetical protein